MFFSTDVRNGFYPNPTTNFFTIQLSGSNQTPVNYSLIDICGRIMQSGLVFNKESVDFTTAPKGIYLVKLSAETQHQFIKVIKN